ncbi:MAG: hypothetical protein WDO13_13810 [Verrucomicrobiota bacterium]
MSNRFLIGIGIAFVVIFGIGFAAVIGITSLTDEVTVADYAQTQKPVDASVSTAVAPSFAPFTAPAAQHEASATTEVRGTPIVGSQIVLDTDLAKLAAAVKLGGSATGDVSKDVWARQIPVAQKLLKKMCDCDQRNWLNHFVQTGQEAVSGSHHYPESVQLLAKLRRSDHDLARGR